MYYYEFAGELYAREHRFFFHRRGGRVFKHIIGFRTRYFIIQGKRLFSIVGVTTKGIPMMNFN